MHPDDSPLTVVIADDHPLFRMGLKEVIAADRTLRIVGDAADGAEALEFIRSLQPEIAILDLDMPGTSGIDAMRIIASERLPVSVIVLTMYDDREMFDQVMALGAMGYILKDSAAKEITRGIHTVADGDYYLSPSLAGEAMKARRDEITTADYRLGFSLLTRMERTILRRIAASRKTSEIAEELHISPRTVENHRAHMCTKLGLKGPYALIRFAFDHRRQI